MFSLSDREIFLEVFQADFFSLATPVGFHLSQLDTTNLSGDGLGKFRKFDAADALEGSEMAAQEGENISGQFAAWLLILPQRMTSSAPHVRQFSW